VISIESTPDFAKTPKVGKSTKKPTAYYGGEFSLKKFSIASLLIVATFVLALPIGSVFATTPGFGNLYYNGSVVRTVVPPAAFPNTGIDNFYKVTNGAVGQLGIASVAPGADGYHGGHWKVFIVTFNQDATPVLLTSQAAVLAAQSAGTVAVTRNASADFLCPVQL
jgi:hypothetical protein